MFQPYFGATEGDQQSRTFKLSTSFLSRALLVGAISFSWPSGMVAAESGAAALQTVQQKYSIKAGSLSHVLSQFAGAAGVALSFDASPFSGMTSSGLNGKYSIQEGFVQLLAGTNTLAVDQGNGNYTLEELPVSRVFQMDNIVVSAEMTNFGATKSSIPVVETARSVSIETEEQFVEKGALNLAQTVTYMAGVTGEPFGFATRGDFVHSRGLDIPRYRDSIQELFGSYNTTRADIFTIEQVEVLKGPASVLYGQGSPGGIVNYVSKAPKRYQEGEVTVEYGNFNRKELGLDVTGPVSDDNDKFFYRMVALYRDSDTQVDFVEDNTKIFMPSITFAPSDFTSFTLIGLHQDTKSDSGAQFIPVEGTLLPLTGGGRIDQDVYVGEPGFNRFDTKSTQLTFLAEHQFNDVFSLDATALWRKGEADYRQAWAAFNIPGQSRYLNDIIGLPVATSTTVPRSFFQADNTSEQYATDIRLTASFDTGKLSHEVLLGTQYQHVETDNDTAFLQGGGAFSGDFRFVLDLANPVYTGAPVQSVFDGIRVNNPKQTVKDLGFYVSDQISFDAWRFTAGLRYDDVENDNGTRKQTDTKVSTSFGALYKFDNGLSPYVSYAESFETVIGTGSGSQPKPEEGEQYEVGIKYEPDSFPGLFTLSYFDIEISNLPNPNSLPSNATQQQGVSKIKGVEFESKMRLGEFYVQAALAVLDAEDPNGFEMAAEPERNGSLWVSWQPEGDWDGFRAGAGVRYIGSSISENSTFRYKTPSYTLGDLMLGYEFDRHWDFAFNVRNVTDEKYLTACLSRGDCFPGLRRSVNATLRYSF